METWYLRYAHQIEKWVPALFIALGTIIVSGLTRAFLTRVHKSKNWRILRELAPAISNVVYIIGLRLFAEFAPLVGHMDIWFDHTVYVLSIIVYLNFLERLALFGIEWSALKAEHTDSLKHGFVPLLRNVVTLFIFFSGGIMILKHFSYDVMSLITALGVSSLAVGLAAKDTLSNMISGFILIIDKNLRPGDRVNLNGTIGDVGEIGLRSTKIKMGEGNTLIVPNSDLVNTKIINLSMPSRSTSCTTSVRVPCTASFSEIKSACLSIIKEIPTVDHLKVPAITLFNLSDGHQQIQVGFWVHDLNDTGIAISDFNEKLLSQLQSKGIPLITPGCSGFPPQAAAPLPRA